MRYRARGADRLAPTRSSAEASSDKNGTKPPRPRHRLRAATELAKLIRTKKLGALELLDFYVDRMERRTPRSTPSSAPGCRRPQGGACPRQPGEEARRELGPLHGVPMTVKELFDLPGLPTTWGLPQQANNAPTKPALAVERLERAGAVIRQDQCADLVADWQTQSTLQHHQQSVGYRPHVRWLLSGGQRRSLAAGLTGLELRQRHRRLDPRSCPLIVGRVWPQADLRDRTARWSGFAGSYAPGDMSVIVPLAARPSIWRWRQDHCWTECVHTRGIELALPEKSERKWSESPCRIMPTASCAEA